MAERKPKRSVGYTVGHGRPPEASRFRKGVSGNPAGRPKGALNLQTVLERALREPVIVREGGRTRRITKLEATAKQLANQSASGELAAIRLVQSLTAPGDAEAAPDAERNEVAHGDDEEVARHLMARLRKFAEGNPE